MRRSFRGSVEMKFKTGFGIMRKLKSYSPDRLWKECRARWHRFRYLRKTKILAVTGSCGKTTATYFLGRILGECGPCYAGVHRNTSRAIYKNMRKMRTSYRYLVQEMGVASPGDMAKNIRALPPHIGIVTTIGLDHYTSFRTPEATAAEKGTLIAALPPSGTAVLNADDPHAMSMASLTGARVLTYGCSERADVRGSAICSDWPQRLSLNVTYGDQSVRVETGLFGDLLVTSLLAAIAGALAAGVSLAQCAASLHGVESFPARLSIHRSPQGAWMINDTFKAPFWSVERTVGLMKNAVAPRKTVVLGVFSDTGGSVSRKYRAMAKLALEVADRVVFVGGKAVHVRKIQTAELADRLFVFDGFEAAYRFLADTTIQNELVLLKSGSRYHLERMLRGHEEGFNCWRETCSEKIDCADCPNRFGTQSADHLDC